MFLMGRQETTSSLMGDYGDCVCSKKTNMKAIGKSHIHQEVYVPFLKRDLLPILSSPHPTPVAFQFLLNGIVQAETK